MVLGRFDAYTKIRDEVPFDEVLDLYELLLVESENERRANDYYRTKDGSPRGTERI